MQLIRGMHNAKVLENGCVATIGNYDGMHLGHQAIVEQLIAEGRKRQLPVVVITFEPQPGEFFKAADAPARLTRLREKVALFDASGIDILLSLQFNQALADLSPQVFVRQILIDKLNVQHLLVGGDFRFGHRREGDVALLKQFMLQTSVESVATVEYMGDRISSTEVRRLLDQGDLKSSKKLLGRDYSMRGRVAHGDKRGREWGIPTANVYLHRNVSPIEGVYCVEVKGIDDTVYQGVANVGNRPSVGGGRSLLEVHLFDFNRNIYGCHVEVIFIHKLRSEQRFESLDVLKQQIFDDIDRAKQFFAHNEGDK